MKKLTAFLELESVDFARSPFSIMKKKVLRETHAHQFMPEEVALKIFPRYCPCLGKSAVSSNGASPLAKSPLD
jgi:hypothetical protein